MQRLMKTSPGLKGEIVRQDDDVTVLRLPVTIFGSPEKKDLHDEYFHEGTYFGDDVLTVKFAVYEHFMNPMVNPFASQDPRDHLLGKATLAKTDDGARWCDFEISRRNKYHNYILALNEKGYIGTSSQCFPGTKVVGEDGRIDSWIENELSLTPTPADPTSVPGIADELAALAKSFGLPPPELGEQKSETETPTPTPDPVDPDFTEQLESILNPEEEKPESEAEEATPAPNEPASEDTAKMFEILKQVQADVAVMKAYVWGDISVHASPSEGETLADTLRALQELVGSGNAGISKVQKGLLSLASFVADKAAKGAAEQVRKSLDEQEAEDLAAPTSASPRKKYLNTSIPDHAPGA